MFAFLEALIGGLNGQTETSSNTSHNNMFGGQTFAEALDILEELRNFHALFMNHLTQSKQNCWLCNSNLEQTT